jgi:hypothetical protein
MYWKDNEFSLKGGEKFARDYRKFSSRAGFIRLAMTVEPF